MASKIQITSNLLAATGHGTMEDFITKYVDKGLDAAEIRLEFFKATGLEYDRRTVARWMVTYGGGS